MGRRPGGNGAWDALVPWHQFDAVDPRRLCSFVVRKRPHCMRTVAPMKSSGSGARELVMRQRGGDIIDCCILEAASWRLQRGGGIMELLWDIVSWRLQRGGGTRVEVAAWRRHH